MIPSQVVNSFVVALIFTTVVPILLLIILAIKKKISGLPLLFGALAFFVSQIIIRIPLINIFSTFDWFQSFAMLFIPYALVLSFTAGLFEESARLGGALLLKKRRSFKDVISFGLGHGICEVILLVGLAHMNNLIYCFTINNPGGELAAVLPLETIEAVRPLLLDVNPVHVYLGILERVFIVVVHICLTVLVFQGVIKKKWWYFVLAIFAHTLVNFIAVILHHYVNIYISEAALFVFALVMGWYVLKSKSNFEESISIA